MSSPTIHIKRYCMVLSENTELSSSCSYLVYMRYCRLSRDGWIYLFSPAIARAMSLNFARFKASSFFKPIFSISSSACFFFDRPHFLLPLTSRSRETLKTLSPFILSTCPYHLTLFVGASQSIVSFNPACPSVLQYSFCVRFSDRTWLSL